ncbi:MAG: hypothetical protein EXR49_01150 [Dehalococcoidia bacterium]|nr:hypothetical protein [Dehalococcoidia bacterium]
MEMLQMAAILFIGIILPSVLLDMIGAPSRRASVRGQVMGGGPNNRWPFGGSEQRRHDKEERDEQRQADGKGNA